MSVKNKNKPVTDKQITDNTSKAYKAYEPCPEQAKHEAADVETGVARYHAGVAARADGFTDVPSAKDANATERRVRGKGASGKKTMKQLLASATKATEALDDEHLEVLFKTIGAKLGYEV